MPCAWRSEGRGRLFAGPSVQWQQRPVPPPELLRPPPAPLPGGLPQPPGRVRLGSHRPGVGGPLHRAFGFARIAREACCQPGFALLDRGRIVKAGPGTKLLQRGLLGLCGGVQPVVPVVDLGVAAPRAARYVRAIFQSNRNILSVKLVWF